jgi:hypothetical protein
MMLALATTGLIEVIAGLGAAWRWLAQTLLLALLALGMVVAAQRSDDRRFAWLLSGGVAVGLAIAAFYNLIVALAAPALPVAGAAIFIAIVLFFLRRRGTRRSPRR